MNVLIPDLFVSDTCQLGEGPFWWQERLWWVDVDVGQLHSVDGSARYKKTYCIGQRIGAAAPLVMGGFIVGVEEGIGTFDPDLERLEILHRPEQHIEGSRFNDGKCDPRGRFVAGTLNRTGRQKSSALYSMDRRGNLQKLIAPVSLSNGMAWNANGTVFYYIDTPTRELAVFSYDLHSGLLGNRRTAIRFPDNTGWPDGMCIDQAGKLWVAHWGGSSVRCWCPETGECLAEIRMPCTQPTSCCFGGPDFASLYITTARQSEDLSKHPGAGSIYVCPNLTPGLPGDVCAFERANHSVGKFAADKADSAHE